MFHDLVCGRVLRTRSLLITYYHRSWKTTSQTYSTRDSAGVNRGGRFSLSSGNHLSKQLQLASSGVSSGQRITDSSGSRCAQADVRYCSSKRWMCREHTKTMTLNLTLLFLTLVILHCRLTQISEELGYWILLNRCVILLTLVWESHPSFIYLRGSWRHFSQANN